MDEPAVPLQLDSHRSLTVLESVAELNLEGIVCKHLDSPYKPGIRSPRWIKTPLRRRSEFVIGGWLPALGPNRHGVGALLSGAHRGCFDSAGLSAPDSPPDTVAYTLNNCAQCAARHRHSRTRFLTMLPGPCAGGPAQHLGES